jgi:MFS family permease
MTCTAKPLAIPERTAAEHAHANRNVALILLWLVYTTSVLDRYAMGILAEPLKRDLGISDTVLGFLSGAVFGLFYATLAIPIARLADRTNRRNLVAAALTLWSAFTMACGAAGNAVQLALARLFVGVGEAGSGPPSHSMLADLFPVKERGRVMGIFASGTNLGILLAFVIGGWIASNWGWRATFVALGVPGIVLAIAVMLLLKEPQRGQSDGHVASSTDRRSLGEVLRFAAGNPVLRNAYIAIALVTFCGSVMALWVPAFLIRAHGVSVSQVGQALGLLFGVFGFVGTISVGWISDRLGKRDVRWRIAMPAVTQLVSWPLFAAALFANDFATALILLVVPGALITAAFGPTIAVAQTVAPIVMRATISALGIFFANVVGLIVGPQLVGVVSDLLAGGNPVRGLQLSLAIFSLAYVWSAFHFWRAAVHLKNSTQEVSQNG